MSLPEKELKVLVESALENGTKYDDYFDLVEKDIDVLLVEKNGVFNCLLKNSKEMKSYKGFILAKSKAGSAFTLCDIDFQKSDTDDKFQPRLTFRRTDKNLQDKKVNVDAIYQRISFEKGQDGYREFWKMVAFLYRFKDLVDVGEFQERYQVISDSQFIEYLNNEDGLKDFEKLRKLASRINYDSAAILNTALIIDLLKKNKEKLLSFINKSANEKEVQAWIDEDDHKYRNQRCLIFGLEFVRHQREGGASGNRYDLLTRIGSQNKERILLELKSPSDEIFDTTRAATINKPKEEFALSRSLSRAIPQILEYKNILEAKNPGDPELQKIGENNKLVISKCAIVIGKQIENNARWENNLKYLRQSLNSNLEIWTYTDLINKLDATIENLEMQISA